MKNTDEFQLDGLDGIRFAPPWIVRKRWRGGERVHSLALRVGVWRGKKYASAFVSRGRGAPLRLAQAGFVLPVFSGFERSGKAAAQIMACQQRNVRPESKAHYARRPHKESAGLRVAAAAKYETPDYSGLGVRRGRFRVASVGKEKSFAPPPPAGRIAGFSQTRAMAEAQALPGKIYEPAVGDKPTAPPEVLRFKDEGHNLQRKSTVAARGGCREQVSSSPGGVQASGGRFSDALEEYFFQQSRLAPSGGAAFDLRLSPLWPGLKLPG